MSLCSYDEVNTLITKSVGAKDAEHAHQRAVFQFLALARVAMDANSSEKAYVQASKNTPVRRLEPNWFCYVADGTVMHKSFDAAMLVQTELLFAIPNGGARDKVTAGKLKAEGVRRGVPDMMLPVVLKAPSIYQGARPGLYIEMKRPEEKKVGKVKDEIIARAAGMVSATQEQWHERLSAQGYFVAVCYSFNEALTAIYYYLSTDWNLHAPKDMMRGNWQGTRHGQRTD